MRGAGGGREWVSLPFLLPSSSYPLSFDSSFIFSSFSFSFAMPSSLDLSFLPSFPLSSLPYFFPFFLILPLINPCLPFLLPSSFYPFSSDSSFIFPPFSFYYALSSLPLPFFFSILFPFLIHIFLLFLFVCYTFSFRSLYSSIFSTFHFPYSFPFFIILHLTTSCLLFSSPPSSSPSSFLTIVLFFFFVC